MAKNGEVFAEQQKESGDPEQKKKGGLSWNAAIAGVPFDEVVSGLQKMIRRGKEKEALILMLGMLDANYGKYLCRRLRVIAAEDVGLAAPQVVVAVYALTEAWLHHREESPRGAPELTLALAVMLMCRAPKNNEAAMAVAHLGDQMSLGKLSVAKVVKDNEKFLLDMHTKRGRAILGSMAEVSNIPKDRANWLHWYYVGSRHNRPTDVGGFVWNDANAEEDGIPDKPYTIPASDSDKIPETMLARLKKKAH